MARRFINEFLQVYSFQGFLGSRFDLFLRKPQVMGAKFDLFSHGVRKDLM